MVRRIGTVCFVVVNNLKFVSIWIISICPCHSLAVIAIKMPLQDCYSKTTTIQHTHTKFT